jgi:hypothetical protein
MFDEEDLGNGDQSLPPQPIRKETKQKAKVASMFEEEEIVGD